MRLLFVCIENSNRSQMAEAFAHLHGGEDIEAYSAGSRPSGQVNPKAVELMKEKGYDLATHRSKGLEEVPDGPYDAVVTMGCGEECPYIPARERMDWSLPDPKEMDEDGARWVRDVIEKEVMDLVEDLRKEGGGE